MLPLENLGDPGIACATCIERNYFSIEASMSRGCRAPGARLNAAARVGLITDRFLAYSSAPCFSHQWRGTGVGQPILAAAHLSGGFLGENAENAGTNGT